jgi:hypothetical protein
MDSNFRSPVSGEILGVGPATEREPRLRRGRTDPAALARWVQRVLQLDIERAGTEAASLTAGTDHSADERSRDVAIQLIRVWQICGVEEPGRELPEQ